MSLLYPKGTVPIPAPCECRRTRNAPVHMTMTFCEAMRGLIKENPGVIPEDMVSFTVFCRRCKKIAEATAGMAGLVDPSTMIGAMIEPST